ncbi:hypothetical protein LZQ00_17290 [Sphingobacterium sp. SRCM116780]|uniref:hypothetical protein n=1 Tax=Sphingobacterium sp. SRCM116780 TaxID=2907623 RepID=UPI001F1ED0B8|nr:hypothetical protein [Sphingobacterium sp. SRCM116780]UIR56005.1 hypothetical protein LZQ00_17290 [Sphingobacterium sp. SRCM116780]
MSIIFISFADDKMAFSLERIGKQAKKLQIFDQIILYTPDQLPDYIKDSPLMQYKRGGGYWSWKPAIIYETLQQYEEGTIVVYTDAGCSLFQSSDWNDYFSYLKNVDTLCFQYKDEMPEWEKFGQTSTKIKYWTKESTISYFAQLLADESYGDRYNKIWGGAIICKGRNNAFIKKWLDITIKQPNLIIDPTEEELKDSKNKELAYHKHDQSIITPLAHYFNTSVLILQEKAETSTEGAIIASRVRAQNKKEYLKLVLKDKMRSLLGKGLYNTIKARIKKVVR